MEGESAVIARLEDRGALVVVDEAHLRQGDRAGLRPALLDELRCIRDLAGCGLVLIADNSILIRRLSKCDRNAAALDRTSHCMRDGRSGNGDGPCRFGIRLCACLAGAIGRIKGRAG